MKPHIFQQGPVLHAVDAGSADGWQLFGESPAMKWHELNTERCAPPIFVAVPGGIHVVTPQGAARTMVLTIDASWARRMDRHLQAMRASGQRPFYDFQHQAGTLGYPQRFFWDARRGVMSLTEWTPEAERLIASGECNSFSPKWVGNGADFFGLGLNCGALVHRSSTSAFRKMPKIAPITKRAAMEVRAELYLRMVDQRNTELKQAGPPELTALKAFDQVGAEYPALRASYELQAALRDELRKDAALR